MTATNSKIKSEVQPIKTQVTPQSAEERLRQLDDRSLLESTRLAVAREREASVLVLRHLAEVEKRRLYLDRGYSSLWDFARKECGYSEGAAQRRISAMRLLGELPEVEKQIDSGAISLSVAAQAQSFFKSQEKAANAQPLAQTLPASQMKEQGGGDPTDNSAAPFSKEEKLRFVQSLEGKSSREVEREILRLAPQEVPKEKLRAVTETHTEVRLVLDQELKDQLDELKHLLSHKNPKMDYSELLRHLAAIALAKLQKKKSSSAKESPGKEKPTGEKLASQETVTAQCEPDLDLSEHAEAEVLSMATSVPETVPPPTSAVPGTFVFNSANSHSRWVPASVQREVWERDGCQCSYVDPLTGRRCESQHLLQLDHIFPFAKGGTHSTENLRVLCQQHNLRAAEFEFGKRKMRSARATR